MIHDVAPQIAEAMLPMVRQYPTAPHPLQRYYYTSLKWMARHLESFVEPQASVAAQKRADEMGLGDLRRYRWLDQPSRMKDIGRQIFHWEHATQTSDIVKQLLRLPDPIVEAIAS